MVANLRMAKLALLLAGLGAASAAQAGLGPIHVLSAAGETFYAEIPVTDETIKDYVQINLADRNKYPQLTAYSGSSSDLTFTPMRDTDGRLQKVMVSGPSAFKESLLRFALEVSWPSGKLVREYDVDYKHDGPHRKTPAPTGGDNKRHAATSSQGPKLDSSGLGELRVSSRLGEQLMAELPLFGDVFDKAEFMDVAVFVDAKNGKHPDPEQLKLVASITPQLDRGIDGRRILNLASTLPITVPNLAFRLEVTADNVKVRKNYVLSLEGSLPAAQAAPAPAAAPEPPAAAKNEAADTIYIVRKGDTLSSIAMRMQDHAPRENVAQRLLRDNPQAFIAGDPNRVRAGANLRYPSAWDMPEPMEAAAKPNSTAKVAEADSARMEKPRAGLFPPLPIAKPKAPPAPGAKLYAKSTPPLEITPSAKQRSESMSAHAPPQPEAATAERRAHNLSMQEKELKQIEQRSKALEERLHALQPAQNQSPATAKSTVKNHVEHQAAKQQNPPITPPVKPQVSALHGPPELLQPPQTKSKPDIRQQAAAPTAAKDEQAAINDQDVQLKLGGAAAALALVTLLLIRRRHAAADLTLGVETNGENASAKMQLKQLVSLMSFLKTDDRIDLSAIPAMAEAEVYLAYGRTDHAVLALREGLAKEPMRQDLRYKLLEVLAARPDKEEFIEEAAAAQRMFSQRSAMWHSICELGRSQLPNHSLFIHDFIAEPQIDEPKLVTENVMSRKRNGPSPI